MAFSFPFAKKFDSKALGFRIFIFPHITYPPKPNLLMEGLGFEPIEIESLFKNESDFWTFFDPFGLKWERGEGNDFGKQNSEIVQYYRIIQSNPNFLPFLKVIKKK